MRTQNPISSFHTADAPAPPLVMGHGSFRPKGGAFTIIELVVVIGIMMILVAITMPAIKSLTRNNNQKQAVNLLTSLIAHAHSLALQSHSPAGLVIYEDPTTKGQSSAQLVISTTTSLTDIVRAPRTGPQPLPRGVKVATLDDSSSDGFFKSADSVTGTTPCRLIYFDGNGQMVLRGNFTSSDPSASSWNITTGNPVSTPGFVVFNANDLQAAKDKGTVFDNPSLGNWLKQNADILIINAYTGNVIR